VDLQIVAVTPLEGKHTVGKSPYEDLPEKVIAAFADRTMLSMGKQYCASETGSLAGDRREQSGLQSCSNIATMSEAISCSFETGRPAGLMLGKFPS